MNLPAKQGDYTVDPQYISAMAECYPHLDMDRELLKMKGWLLSNGLKSDRGMKRFMNGWLSRAKPEPVNKPDERGLIEKHTNRDWRIGLLEGEG